MPVGPEQAPELVVQALRPELEKVFLRAILVEDAAERIRVVRHLPAVDKGAQREALFAPEIDAVGRAVHILSAVARRVGRHRLRKDRQEIENGQYHDSDHRQLVAFETQIHQVAGRHFRRAHSAPASLMADLLRLCVRDEGFAHAAVPLSVQTDAGISPHQENIR